MTCVQRLKIRQHDPCTLFSSLLQTTRQERRLTHLPRTLN